MEISSALPGGALPEATAAANVPARQRMRGLIAGARRLRTGPWRAARISVVRALRRGRPSTLTSTSSGCRSAPASRAAPPSVSALRSEIVRQGRWRDCGLGIPAVVCESEDE
jgi:hypothetical protein